MEDDIQKNIQNILENWLMEFIVLECKSKNFKDEKNTNLGCLEKYFQTLKERSILEW